MVEYNTYIELLDRFMSGKTSPEEETILLEWFRNARSKDETLAYYRQKWEETSGNQLSAEVQGRMFHEVKIRMKAAQEAGKKTGSVPHRPILRRWWLYAAAVLLCIGLGFGSHVLMRNTSQIASKDYIVSADKGQRAGITLPDGTKVWLNSHTHITYTTEYGVEERVVRLTGEAYFEVAKDTERRFVVKAGELEIEALGTTFNVKAYEEDKELTATLFEGSIRAVAGKETVTLVPDQHIRYDKVGKQLRMETPLNSSYSRMWRNDELAFDGETLEDIAILLNRIYNVQVVFKSNKIKQYRFSGVIKNNSLDNVFEIISLTAPILYESKGDTIMLREK